MIVMGDDTLVLPKENVADPIESIVAKLPRVFLPAGKTIDLTEWFDVTPAGAVKSAVQYYYADGAPISVDLAGKVTADGNTGSIAVTIVARNDENIKATIYVRTGPVVGDEPATSAPADAMYLFKDSFADFSALRAVGGAATWNPFNGAIAALPGGGASGHNIYFRPQPVNSGLTKENGHLYFKWYIKDVTKLVSGSGQVELTSSDNPDAQEMNWSTSFIANCHNGWNEVDLAFADATDIAADFNPNNINWFRFFNQTTVGSEDPYEVAMVKDVCVYKVPVVESVTAKIPKIFVPVGKTLDLTEWFDVTPVDVPKTAVNYTFEGSAFTIAEDGKLTATGIGSTTVTIASKTDAEVKATITVRTGPVVGDEPATSAPANAQYLFKDSYDDYAALRSVGGAATWNPFNGAIAALVSGGGSGHNIYFRPQAINSGLTRENGHLYFKWYIKDVTKLDSGVGQIELTSGDNPDAQEMNWSTSFIANCHNGWNEVDLAFADATDIAADFNPNNINWFRFFNQTTVGSEDPYEVAMVKDVCVYKLEPVTGITVNGNHARGLILFEPVGTTINLMDYITLTPADASAKGLVFSSANADAVAVDENGVVTCKARGSIGITVASKADPENVKATIYVRTNAVPSYPERSRSEGALVHSCDNTEGFVKTADATRTLEIVTSGQKEGTGWYKSTTKTAELVVIGLSGVDVQVMASSRAHVSFWFYAENAAQIKGIIAGGRTEIGNDGGNKGLYWPSKDVFANLQDGWNLIDLAIKDAKPYGVDSYALDPEHVRWFRIHFDGGAVGNTDITWGIDDIRVYESFAETTAAKKYLLHPTFDEYKSLTVGGSCSWSPSQQAFGAIFAAGGAGSKNIYFQPASVNSGATIANGHLHFKWYVSDIASLAIGDNDGQVELCSGGSADNQELTFISDKFLKYCQSGWNDVVLDFNLNQGNGGFDPSNINWFRFYDNGAADGAEMIKDVYVYVE